MKKAYFTPSFRAISLDTNGGSTGACEVKTASWGFETCKIDIGDGIFFFGGPNGIDGCTDEPMEGPDACYGVFGPDDGVVFGS